ncbi:MAG: class I SAM-dependent methyltransferase [Alphaproteobacteria bacterium]|jgi:SAM-dependent methyltransferase|nr:class I SAM-dependent methyltransferase [Thalassospira sp.]MCE2964315.1 class I SAM-dependent methyltransferase [Alphaproteobacteria bacterium]
MHDTALDFGARFFNTYLKGVSGQTFVEIGAQDVNGSLRSVAPTQNTYVGVDFVEGKGVDVVLTDPYTLPFADASVDVCLSSSCFEHSEFFWLLFNEILRIVKPHGLIYLNVPSNGHFHRYPVDCWRFFPDSGMALERWARRSGFKPTLLETFTGRQKNDVWNDCVQVFVKDEAYAAQYPNRIQDTLTEYTNGLVLGETDFRNFTHLQEDQENSLGKVVKKKLTALGGKR